VAVADVRGGAVVDWREHDVGWDAAHESGTEGAHHARVARFLKDNGVQTVVAHHMGDGMSRMLLTMGLEVRLGASGDARTAAVTAAGRRLLCPTGQPGRHVHEQLAGVRRQRVLGGRERKLVCHRTGVIGQLPIRVVDAGELPDHPQEVRLTTEQVPSRDARGLRQRGDPEVLARQHRLGLHQLFVEPVQRQRGGQHGVLDVEQTVVAGGQLPGLREPGLGAWVRGLDGHVDDLGDRGGPVAEPREVLLLPCGVGDDVDGHRHAHLARHLQGLEVHVRRGALAEGVQAFLVERLQTEEHVVQSQAPPALEHLSVAQQDVRARLQVVLLTDAATLDLPGDRVPVLGTDERHVVHQEDARLADLGEVVGGRFGRHLPVLATVEGPRAAERAIPGTAT
jgi:predicted Fe-Mo cluster-binding NifX family protein